MIKDFFTTPITPNTPAPAPIKLTLSNGSVIAQSFVCFNDSTLLIAVYINRNPQGAADYYVGPYTQIAQSIQAETVWISFTGGVPSQSGVVSFEISDVEVQSQTTTIQTVGSNKRYFNAGFDGLFTFTSGNPINAKQNLIAVSNKQNPTRITTSGGMLAPALVDGDDLYIDELILCPTAQILVSLNFQMASDTGGVINYQLPLPANVLTILHPGIILATSPLTPGSRVINAGDTLQMQFNSLGNPTASGTLYYSMSGHMQ